MDDSPNGLDWNQARAFLAAAETGSFTAAARRLSLTQPTLGRQVSALEETLGIVLFERAGRQLVLTEGGRRLLEHFRSMGEAATRISLGAAAHSRSISGRVSIAATDTVVAFWIIPLLERVRQVAPRLKVDLVISDALVDPGRREADIAIRHSRPTQSYLIARKLRDTSVHLYGSRQYLDRCGRPRKVADLARADFVGFAPLENFVAAMGARGMPVEEAQVRTVCNSGLIMCELIREGHGLGVLTRAIGERFGDLEQVLPEGESIAFPVWLTTHRELYTSRAIRLVFDIVAEAMA